MGGFTAGIGNGAEEIKILRKSSVLFPENIPLRHTAAFALCFLGK